MNIWEILIEIVKIDFCIKLIFCFENGNISVVINFVVELVMGDFIFFLDNDDEFILDVLGEVVLYIS